MRNLILFIFCLYSSISVAASHYGVEVMSFGEYDMNGKTFIIIPANEHIDENDLEFKEYSGYIKKLLATVGAKEASKPEIADICILMNYEITNQSYSETVAIPVFGKTGINSITTNSQSTGTSNAYVNANTSTYGNSSSGTAYGNASGSSNTTSTTNINYSYGIAGYNNVQRHVEDYLRVINLYAYENKDVEKPVMTWKTNIMSDGTTNSLKPIVTVMAFGALGLVGTSKTEKIKIQSDNKNFQLFSTFKINGDNVYVLPTISSFSADERLRIVAIERKPNETVITFYNEGIPYISISKNMYLEFDGNKIYPTSSENIKLSRQEKNKTFFTITYPAIPKDIKSINLSEEDDTKIRDVKKRKYWKSIKLEK